MKRRTVLGLMGASLAAPMVMPPSVARADGHSLNPSNPDDVLLMYRKLAHSTDESIVYWWAHLDRAGLVDGELIPFWRVHVAALITTRDIDDSGAYEATAISIVAYTDLETGEFMETFKNPITGTEVPIGYFPSSANKTIYTRDGSQAKPPPREGFKITTNHPLTANVEGDDVWVYADDMTRVEPETPDAGRLFAVADINTYQGRMSEVANPDIASAPATWDFNDVLSWPPWMQMGDQPGYYVSRGHGRKVYSFDEMPAETAALAKMRYPDVYADPRAALSGS